MVEGIEIQPARSRVHCDKEKPVQMTRIPRWRAGNWVLMGKDAPGDLAGKVRQLKALTCSIADNQAVWRVHTMDGRCVLATQVERFATENEIRTAEARRAV